MKIHRQNSLYSLVGSFGTSPFKLCCKQFVTFAVKFLWWKYINRIEVSMSSSELTTITAAQHCLVPRTWFCVRYWLCPHHCMTLQPRGRLWPMWNGAGGMADPMRMGFLSHRISWKDNFIINHTKLHFAVYHIAVVSLKYFLFNNTHTCISEIQTNEYLRWVVVLQRASIYLLCWHCFGVYQTKKFDILQTKKFDITSN